jgi:hypothetical protein
MLQTTGGAGGTGACLSGCTRRVEEAPRCISLCRALGGSGGAISWLEPGNLQILGCNAPPGSSPVLLDYEGSLISSSGTPSVTTSDTLTVSRVVPVLLALDTEVLDLGNYTLTYRVNASLLHVLPRRFRSPYAAKPLNWTLPASSLGLLANNSEVKHSSPCPLAQMILVKCVMYGEDLFPAYHPRIPQNRLASALAVAVACSRSGSYRMAACSHGTGARRRPTMHCCSRTRFSPWPWLAGIGATIPQLTAGTGRTWRPRPSTSLLQVG